MINIKQISMKMTIVLGLFMPIQMVQAVELSLDNSSALNLANDVNFNLTSDELRFNILDPIICHNENQSSATYITEIIDPNGDGAFMPLLSNVAYNISSQLIKAQVDSVNGVCVTKSGSSFGDLIFENAFSTIIPDLRYEGIGEQVVRNQSLDYSIIVENNENTSLNFTLIEYVSTDSATNGSFFESVDAWSCLSHGNNNVDCNEDDTDNVLGNASIPAGESLTIDVSRTVGANSLVGQPVEILTAMFITDAQNEIVDVKVINTSPVVVDNAAPSISWKDGVTPVISFIEDTPLEIDQVGLTQRISFDINDETGLNVTETLIRNSISVENEKLDIINVAWTSDNGSEYNVDVDLLPAADAFTIQDEDIVIQIQDEFGSFSGPLSTSFEILPLNDPPNFDLACSNQGDFIVIRPTPIGGELEIECLNSSTQLRQGSFLFEDLISNLTNGDTGTNQLIDLNIINQSGIFQGVDSAEISIENFFTDLMIDVNGETGMGTFQLEVFDNGTPNGESDVCPAGFAEHCSMTVSPVITVMVENPVYFVSGVVNGLPSNQRIILEMIDVNQQISLDTVTVQNGDTMFDFSAALVDQTGFLLTIVSQPINQDWTCEFGDTETNTTQGIINGANIGNIIINCSELP